VSVVFDGRGWPASELGGRARDEREREEMHTVRWSTELIRRPM